MTPIVLVARELTELVRAREYQRAVERVREAERALDASSFQEAQRTVQALNQAIVQAKLQKQKIVEELAGLDAENRALAESVLLPEVNGYFAKTIAKLKVEKAALSDPRGRRFGGKK